LPDSLPRAVIGALSGLPGNLVETDRSLDGDLDASWLEEPAIGQVVEDAIVHFDGQRYWLLAWCIMPSRVRRPNHDDVENSPVNAGLGPITRRHQAYCVAVWPVTSWLQGPSIPSESTAQIR
jgi:hypothetical protein